MGKFVIYVCCDCYQNQNALLLLDEATSALISVGKRMVQSVLA